jgi:hypothetical protein
VAVWAAVNTIVCFGIRAIRARLVYQRSGYVRMRRRPGVMAGVGLLAGMIGALLAMYSVKAGSSRLSPPLLAGLVIGLAMLLAALRQRRWKYVAFAALSVGLGLALQFLRPTLEAGCFWYFLLMGTAYLVTGTLTLYLFVRHTPARTLEVE